LKPTRSATWRWALRATSLGLLIVAMPAASRAAGYQSEAVADSGVISGTIRYAGSPAKPVELEVSKDRDVCGARPLYDQSLVVSPDGGVANAVVTLPDIEKGKALRPQTVEFDQKGCTYIPHVAVFPAGSVVEVRNSDGILHNIHTESTANPVIDMAQPGFKKTIRVTIAKPEAIKVTCDAHNWMEGWWYVTANPYHAITDARGNYRISDVPPGTYNIQVWHEKLADQTRQITVKTGATTTANFTLRAKTD
jgi:plastocyanin